MSSPDYFEIEQEEVLSQTDSPTQTSHEKEPPIDQHPSNSTEKSVIPEEAQQRYRIWKKNAPYLYKYLQTSSLLWPSMTVEFFPDADKNPVDNTWSYRLLLGTFSSGLAEEKLKLMSYTVKDSSEIVSGSDYDQESNEFVASAESRSKFRKLASVQEILHDGEVNKARVMPQKIDVIATINNRGQVFVFDRTKHPSTVVMTSQFRPQITCQYHKLEGYGLSWNHQQEGKLLSAAMDGDVALWDITQYDAKSGTLQPVQVFSNIHSNGVNDAKWIANHESMFVTCGEDQQIKVFDVRKGLQPVSIGACDASINCLSVHGDMVHMATGDNEGAVAIYDARNLNQPAHKVQNAHKGAISVVEWNPQQNKKLISGGQDDGLVKVWDFDESAASDLVFVHGGHMLGINDASWSLFDNTVASVANDNSLHVWKPLG